MTEKTRSQDWLRGLADGLEGKRPAGTQGAEWLAGYEHARQILLGVADGLANRLPDGAQSEAWTTGYYLGQKQRREA